MAKRSNIQLTERPAKQTQSYITSCCISTRHEKYPFKLFCFPNLSWGSCHRLSSSNCAKDDIIWVENDRWHDLQFKFRQSSLSTAWPFFLLILAVTKSSLHQTNGDDLRALLQLPQLTDNPCNAIIAYDWIITRRWLRKEISIPAIWRRANAPLII
jgi:hypothetical protein